MAITRSRSRLEAESNDYDDDDDCSPSPAKKSKSNSVEHDYESDAILDVNLEEEEEEEIEEVNDEESLASTLTSLQELIDSGSGVTPKPSNYWQTIVQRISSHPHEVEMRHLHDVLMILNPVVPPEVVTKIIKATNDYHHSALMFAFTCPWMTNEIMTAIMKTNSPLRNSDLDEVCANVLHLLLSCKERVPPKYQSVEIMMQHMPHMVVLPDATDRDILLHSACWDQRNEKYVELMVKTALEWNPEGETQEGLLEGTYGGILALNKRRIAPIHIIAEKWPNAKGAAMIDKLIKLANIPPEAIAETKVLHEAIKKRKWDIAQVIIRHSPQSLFKMDGNRQIPLHLVMDKDRIGSYATFSYAMMDTKTVEVIRMMIETWIITATTDDQMKLCGGLLSIDWCERTPLKIYFKDGIQEIVTSFLNFVMLEKNGIDQKKYLGHIIHAMITLKHWDLVRYIVSTYPRSLLLADEKDNLPLHNICRSNAPNDIIELMITNGLEQNVGGKNARAGLLKANKTEERPLQLIISRKCTSNGKVLKFLQTFKPKLIQKKDIKELKLMHKVASGGRPAVARALLKLVPKSIAIQDDDGNLPLHIACQRSSGKELMKIFIQHGVKEKVGGKAGYAGLYLKNNAGKTPMDLALPTGTYSRLSCSNIPTIMNLVGDSPIFQSAINMKMERNKLIDLIDRYPRCIHITDADGRLPIHVALTEGLQPSKGLDELISKDTAAMDEVDKSTGLLPFALAITSGKYDLSYLYTLLRKNPSFFSSSEWKLQFKQTTITEFME